MTKASKTPKKGARPQSASGRPTGHSPTRKSPKCGRRRKRSLRSPWQSTEWAKVMISLMRSAFSCRRCTGVTRKQVYEGLSQIYRYLGDKANEKLVMDLAQKT
jgi:hypothetical protein